MKKILLFLIAGYVAYYFGTQHQNLKDRQQKPGSAADSTDSLPALGRPGSSGIVFGKGGDLSLEPCRKDLASLCPDDAGIKGKVACLSMNQTSLSDGCRDILVGK